MKIQIEEWLSGSELRDRIVQRYGSASKLRALSKKGDVDAQDDLFTFQLFEEEPRRLKLRWHTQDVYELEPGDLERLTAERLRLLAFVTEHKEALNVSTLSEALGRDKKNVSEDLRVLQEFGLITLGRVGRETIPTGLKGEIHIVLRQPA